MPAQYKILVKNMLQAYFEYFIDTIADIRPVLLHGFVQLFFAVIDFFSYCRPKQTVHFRNHIHSGYSSHGKILISPSTTTTNCQTLHVMIIFFEPALNRFSQAKKFRSAFMSRICSATIKKNSGQGLIGLI
jgi:hypothetical protein